MAIDQRSHCFQQTIRHMGAKAFDDLLLPILDQSDGLIRRKRPIGQRLRCWSPAAFEGDQAVMILSCSSEIERLRSDRFCLDHRLPKEKWHRPKFVKSFVGAAVLVIT